MHQTSTTILGIWKLKNTYNTIVVHVRWFESSTYIFLYSCVQLLAEIISG